MKILCNDGKVRSYKNEQEFKLTESHFRRFKKECEYWIERFGLKQYEYYYIFNENDTNTSAEFAVWNNAKMVNMYLSSKWHEESVPSADGEIEKVAFHEVCEVLLGDLNIMASAKFSEDETTRALHDVIRRLEREVFWPEWKRRKRRK